MIMIFDYLVRHGEVVQAEYFSLPFHIFYFLFPLVSFFFLSPLVSFTFSSSCLLHLFLSLPSLSFSSLSCHSLCLLSSLKMFVFIYLFCDSILWITATNTHCNKFRQKSLHPTMTLELSMVLKLVCLCTAT